MRWKHGAWLVLALAACNRSPQQQAAMPAPATAPQPAPAAGPVDLSDISERDPRYLIGISFPPELKRHPALAAEVKHDAEAMRGAALIDERDEEIGERERLGANRRHAALRSSGQQRINAALERRHRQDRRRAADEAAHARRGIVIRRKRERRRVSKPA